MIAVTGGTGCIGSNLVRELVRRGEHVALVRLPHDDLAALGDVRDEVEHRIADVRDRDAVERAMAGASHVYHLAGITVPTNALARSMYEVNVLGTQNVMRAALRLGARVVHTSSVAAVGFPQDATVADESFRFNGHGHAYAATKHLGERVVVRYVADGLDAVIVNPSATLAPGGDLRNGWASLVVRLRRGQLPVTTGGGLGITTRRDVVDAHIRAMARGATGERYIVNTANLPYLELLALAASVVGVRAPRVQVPEGLVRYAAIGTSAVASAVIRDPLRRPLLTPENVPLLTRTIYYDAGKAARELGTTRSSLREAVEELVEWCDSREEGR